jgi:hypothetical protein
MAKDMLKYTGSAFINPGDVKELADPGDDRRRRGRKIRQTELIFDDGTKLSVNATNAKVLIRGYGREGEDWIDKKIELCLGELEYDDKANEAVLVKPILSPVEKKKSPDPRKSRSGDMDRRDRILTF